MADFTPNPRTAPTIVTGSRGPENVDSVRVIADVADEIFLYMPSANPLMTLSTKLRKKRVVSQRRFDWFTKDEYPRQIELSAASLVADVTLDVTAGTSANSANGFLYRNLRTGENVHVTANGGTATITVTRGVGTVQQDMEAGDKLMLVSTAFEDGTGKGTLKSVKETLDFNFTQIVKQTYGFTGRQLNTDMYGGKDPATERKWQAIEHAKSLEKLLIWGGRATSTGAGGHELTFADGIANKLQSNVWNLGGTRPTERAFVEFLEQGMKWGKGGNLNGSGKKFLFCSDRWATEIEFFAKDRIRYEPGSEIVAGLKIKSYLSAHGEIFIVPSQILSEDHPDHALLLDLNHIRYVVHRGRDTKIMKNVQAPDIDGEEEYIMTDASVEVALEASHSLLKGLEL
jgi:hypothetical protein